MCIYIIIYPFAVPKLPATIHCCSSLGKGNDWLGSGFWWIFLGMSVETDFGKLKRQGSVRDSRWLPPLQFLQRSEVFGVHCTPKQHGCSKSGSHHLWSRFRQSVTVGVIFWMYFESWRHSALWDCLFRRMVEKYGYPGVPFLVTMGSNGRIKKRPPQISDHQCLELLTC